MPVSTEYLYAQAAECDRIVAATTRPGVAREAAAEAHELRRIAVHVAMGEPLSGRDVVRMSRERVVAR